VTATPGASPEAAQTPTPADVTVARLAITRYTAALIAGRYAEAWAMLGPEARTHWGSLAKFIYDRSAYFKGVAGRYLVITQPPNVAPIGDWLGTTYGAPIDMHHAVLVEITYPALADNNAGDELYIVNPASGGVWIYGVR
jgi:hypothetical protein